MGDPRWVMSANHNLVIFIAIDGLLKVGQLHSLILFIRAISPSTVLAE